MNASGSLQQASSYSPLWSTQTWPLWAMLKVLSCQIQAFGTASSHEQLGAHRKVALARLHSRPLRPRSLQENGHQDTPAKLHGSEITIPCLERKAGDPRFSELPACRLLFSLPNLALGPRSTEVQAIALGSFPKEMPRWMVPKGKQ